jgi:hypothetical protein
MGKAGPAGISFLLVSSPFKSLYSGGTHDLGGHGSTQYAAYSKPCSLYSRACGIDESQTYMSHAALHASWRANRYLGRSDAAHGHCASDAVRESVRLGQNQLYCDLHLPIRPAFHPACVEVQWTR